MSEHMKARHTKSRKYIEVIVGVPGMQESTYKIPNTTSAKERLRTFLQKLTEKAETSWDESIPWEKLASERLAKHSKAGLALRGARYRLGLSQKKLAKQCGISQDNLSRMENGKRVVGIKTAKKLAKALHIDYRLLLKHA